MSVTRQAAEILHDEFLEWAKTDGVDLGSLTKSEFALLVKGFTGGYIKSTQTQIHKDRIKEAIDLLTNVDIPKTPQ